MRFGGLERLLVSSILGVVLVACSTGAPGTTDASREAALQELQGAIEASTGFTAGSIEVLASPVHVHILLSDDKLARADPATRERVALAVVSAVERSMASNARLNSIDEISVAIIHPERAGGLLWSSHTEDVLYFKKDSDQQFRPDVS